jgi:hypothetical protein
MYSVTRNLTIAALLPVLAACSPESVGKRDIDIVGASGHALGFAHGFAGSFPGPTLLAMLILATLHLGVSLRRRAAALRLAPARARRRST